MMKLSIPFICTGLICISLYSFAQKSISKIPEPELFGSGTISTGYYETHPAFTPSGDSLYFLKCLSDANFCSICVSYHTSGSWSVPEVVSFSGQYSDADPFVTRDGKTMYFISNRPIHPGDAPREDWDIWKTERGAGSWLPPVHLDSFFNSSASEYYPTLADNGDLYFGSGRKGGKGRSDIYVARFVNNQYLKPENLGDSINTPDNEYEPFIAPDESYLIFMATIPSGIVHADFYISFNRNGVWSRARKLPPPVNTEATEWGGKVTRDGKYFFFGSSRNPITDSFPSRESMELLNKRLNSPQNGLGDIYRIDFQALLHTL